MIALLENNRAGIAELCEKYGVVKLDVFGSAVNGQFDEATSDLDFIYEFSTESEMSLADRYFGMIESLEKLFGRKIDFISEPSGRNPIFTRSVNRSRETIYRGRGDGQEAA